MKRFELVIEWETLDEFRFGYSYTKDEILSRGYISPRGFKDIANAFGHNLRVDFFRYIYPCYSRTKTAFMYKLEKYEKLVCKGKSYAKLSFIAISIGATIGHLALPTLEPVTYNKVAVVPVKKVEVPAKKKGKTPKKKKAVASTDASLQFVKNKLAYYTTKIKFNPNVKLLYAGKYREELTEPTTNPILQKFDSYADGVLYFYYLCKYHNMTQPNKVNIRAYMAQVGIEMGLRPIKRGWVSTLGTYGNNPHGGKTFEKGATNFILSKDDEYRKGKKVHSKFKIFSNFEEALQDYADMIAAPRYRGGELVEYQREVLIKGIYQKRVTILKNDISPYLNSANWKEFLHGLRVSGYCTAPAGQYERQCGVTYAEQSKILISHGISE